MGQTPGERMLWQSAPPFRAAAILTLWFNVLTLIVFTVSGYFRGPESLHESLVIGVPMMAVDGSLDLLTYLALRWTEPLKPKVRWSIVALTVLAVALTQAVWDTQLRIWADTMTMDL